MEGSTVEGQIDGLKLNDDNFDVIVKPRTNYSSNVLRRVIPNFNKQDKVNTISLNKLNVLSQLRLENTNPQGKVQKVFTVSAMPKVKSLDSKGIKQMLKLGTKQYEKNNNTELQEVGEK